MFDVASLDRDDALNATIWRESPSLQVETQEPSGLAEAGAIGAQQAMCGPPLLPWVPDLVGRRWREPDALIVVGSAYAGFIREYSSRGCTLPLDAYRTAPSWQDFQCAFVRNVVQPDARYYGPVAQLCADVPADGFLVMDLCRVSFVRRGTGHHGRIDQSGDKVVHDGAAVFERYVESPTARRWLWQRLLDSRAKRIVALGQIAEHGLLRLFHEQGLSMALSRNGGGKTWRPATLPKGVWVRRYADSTHALETWLHDSACWSASGTVDGEHRQWQVLPVLHPSRRQRDPHYERTRDVLNKMLPSRLVAAERPTTGGMDDAGRR